MKDIKFRLSAALISDALDNYGFPNQILSSEIKPNFLGAKVFGKIRILTLKSLKNKKRYSEVYKGLRFLELMKKGDVLVVAKGFRNHAFFGEIMSTVAKSRGIEGVVVDGCTRDSLETIKMKYPVFARDNIARDIKKRAIVDKVDASSVRIDGVLIRKGDYLFGDNDGVIIIPKEIKEKIINRALRVFWLEKRIKRGIKNGLQAEVLLNNFGEF